MSVDAVNDIVLQEKLSPEEINSLVELTINGNFGTGFERNLMLGKWYPTVQRLVNCKLIFRYKYSRLNALCWRAGSLVGSFTNGLKSKLT